MRQLLLLFSFLATTYAQGQDYRFGKVEKVDFERITPEDQEEPPAEVLLKKESVQFKYVRGKGFVQTRTVHERIKINTEEGLDYATKKVRLYDLSSSNSERLKGLNGYTYALVDGNVERDKLSSSGEFDEKLNEYWKQTSFTMPNAQVGSIIEYEYYISSPYNAIDDVILQYDIPIRKLDIRVEMIEYFTYNVYFNPRASYVPDLARSVTEDYITYSSDLPVGDRARNGVVADSKQYQLSNQVLTIDDYNIPALVDEPMTIDRSKFRAKILFELAVTKFPDGSIKNYSTNWESVGKSIFEMDQFGGELNRRPFYKEDLEVELVDANDQKTKASRIYKFVKSKVKWNNYYGYRAQKGIKKAYEEGSGNVADINLLLTAMLRNQDIEAYPLLVSSRTNGIPLFPTREGYDYVMAVAVIGGEQIVMDATEAHVAMGDTPLRAANWFSRAIRDDGTSFTINMIPTAVSKSMLICNISIQDDLKITGQVSKRLTGFEAYEYRQKFASRNNIDIIKFLEQNKPGLKIKNVDVENSKTPSKPVNFKYDLDLENSAELIGDKIYISPLLNETTSENPYKLESRRLPIEIGYPIADKRIINFTIPKGYEVVSIPESVRFIFNEGAGNYQFLASVNGSKITVQVDYDLNVLEISPSDYKKWKEFYTDLITKESEKIVLKKI